MFLWVDEEKAEPEGWTRVDNVATAKKFLAENKIQGISISHELREQGGHDLMKWMQKMDKMPRIVMVHSQDPVGMLKLSALLRMKWALDDEKAE